MEKKFTKGPWYVGISVHEEGGTSYDIGGDSPTIEEMRANQKLIAAAPDLLNALQAVSTSLFELMEHCVDMGFIVFDDDIKGVKEYREAIDLSRAAIAKALS